MSNFILPIYHRTLHNLHVLVFCLSQFFFPLPLFRLSILHVFFLFSIAAAVFYFIFCDLCSLCSLFGLSLCINLAAYAVSKSELISYTTRLHLLHNQTISHPQLGYASPCQQLGYIKEEVLFIQHIQEIGPNAKKNNLRY